MLEQQIAVRTVFEGERFDEQEILFAVADKTLADALESDSLDDVGEALRRFRNLSRATSLSAARLFHGVNSNWQEWEHEEGDTFLSWAIRETGYDLQTVKKRVCEWEFLQGNYIPKPYRDRIRDYTVRQLDKVYSIAVSAKENKEGGYLNFIEEDYRISDEQWLRLSEAIDEQMVRDVVLEIKDKDENSNHMSIKIDDMGLLTVYQGKDAVTCGQLFVEKDIKLVQKAIRRICDSSGITEYNNY
jgi:hypothetical protein